MDVALLALDGLVLVAFVIALWRAVVRWNGGWRVLAILVLLAVAAHAIKVTFDLQHDATSHNLWPFEIIVVAGSALIVLAALALIRARVKHRG